MTTATTPRRRRAVDVALFAVSCLVCVGALAGWATQRGEATAAPEVSEFGTRPASTGSTDAPSASTPTPSQLLARAQTPAVPIRQTPFGQVPAALVIPAIGVTADVDRVGVKDDGQVEIPEDGMRIGWYRFGTAPGSPEGSTVLVGHRDTKEQGPGALYRLGDLKPGDQVQILREDWTTLTYSVVARDALAKSEFPGEELFRRTGAPVLTLITCGGDYIPGSGYTENVVVTAVPVDPAT